MLESGDSPAKIVEDKGLKQTSDTGAIEKVIADVLAANAEKVEQYRGGKEALFGFFVGQDRKSTRRTPVTSAHLVCRLLLEKKKKHKAQKNVQNSVQTVHRHTHAKRIEHSVKS